MISNRLFQDCLEDFSNIMRMSMALYDRNRTCVAGEEETLPQEEVFDTFCDSPADMQALGNRYLFKVGDDGICFVCQRRFQGCLSYGPAGGPPVGTHHGDRIQPGGSESVYP